MYAIYVLFLLNLTARLQCLPMLTLPSEKSRPGISRSAHPWHIESEGSESGQSHSKGEAIDSFSPVTHATLAKARSKEAGYHLVNALTSPLTTAAAYTAGSVKYAHKTGKLLVQKRWKQAGHAALQATAVKPVTGVVKMVSTPPIALGKAVYKGAQAVDSFARSKATKHSISQLQNHDVVNSVAMAKADIWKGVKKDGLA